MWLLLAVLFAVGAGLATAVSAMHFAFGLLALCVLGFWRAVDLGVPAGYALMTTMGGFVCAQVGYAVGIGVRAALFARSRSVSSRVVRDDASAANDHESGQSALGRDPGSVSN